MVPVFWYGFLALIFGLCVLGITTVGKVIIIIIIIKEQIKVT